MTQVARRRLTPGDALSYGTRIERSSKEWPPAGMDGYPAEGLGHTRTVQRTRRLLSVQRPAREGHHGPSAAYPGDACKQPRIQILTLSRSLSSTPNRVFSTFGSGDVGRDATVVR